MLDLTGRRFGRLLVTSLKSKGFKRDGRSVAARWFCACDCGASTDVAAGNLTNGGTRSCGCYSREVHRKHMLTKDPLYKTWVSIRLRILDKENDDYPSYGGRGLQMEPDWQVDFALFRSWVLSNIGEKPGAGYTLDRIKNHIGYMRDNLRWATQAQQQNNRRSNRVITFQGQTMTMKQWCTTLGLNYGAVKMRLGSMNWSVEQALTIPTDGTRHRKAKQRSCRVST